MNVISGYAIDLDGMKNSTCGKIGTAQKSGAKYFCKVFNTPVEPAANGALSQVAMEKNAAEFEEFKTRKKRLNKRLREIAGPGGNIVYPLEETVYDHHWTEFSEFVDGALEENKYAEVINSLPEDKKLLVLKIAMGALQTIHNQKIVHADLKLTNIMLVKNGMNNYVSKIIDFDGAFFEDDVPIGSITGTPDYYSPELAIYCSNEDPEFREKHRNWITTKSDIFTMGLILHEYLTGEKPKPDHLTRSLQRMKDSGKFIYPWQVILTRDKGEERPRLVLGSKINNPVYIALISDMLAEDFAERPSASEVLMRLNSSNLPIEKDPWPEDEIKINETQASKHVVALRKYTIKTEGQPDTQAYEIVEWDGKRFLKTAKELVVAAGYAEKNTSEN